MRWRPRVAKWTYFLVEERADARKEEGVAIFPPLVSNPGLNSNKGSRHDQVLASCEGLVELRPDEIIGDLCRGMTGTACWAMVLGNSMRVENSYFRRPKSAQLF